MVPGADFEKYFNDKELPISKWQPAPDMNMPAGIDLIRDQFIKETHGV